MRKHTAPLFALLFALLAAVIFISEINGGNNMKTFNAADYGITPGNEPVSEKLQTLIDRLPDDCELIFPAGRYYVPKVVTVRGKKGLTIKGEGATIVAHFAPSGDPAENNDVFNFRGCSDLVVTGFHFTTDNPVNCTGKVMAVDNAAHTYDVRINDEFPITGYEHFWGTDTFDSEGMPDYVIETYENVTTVDATGPDGKPFRKLVGTKYEVIGEQLIRVTVDEWRDISRLTVGHNILFRYIIYGNHLFGFDSCDRVTLSHIEIERCASMGAVVGPRSSDFTFEDFNIRTPETSSALYAANADGIHILGLSGFLHMKDCDFVGLGDDALNIHSKAYEVKSLGGNRLTVISRDRQKNEHAPNPLWASAGDRVIVYEPSTFREKGSFCIDSVNGSVAVISEVSGEISTGDVLANDSFYASVHIEGCTVKNTRARGLLLQSHNMLIENCKFYGLSLPGLLIAPDIRVWYEVGPSRNTEIRNCVFEKCGMNGSGANLGAICFKPSHDGGVSDYPAGVHQGIYIHDNLFRGNGTSGICVAASTDVRIESNRFESDRSTPNAPDSDHDIVVYSSENVTIRENISDRSLYSEK